MGNQFAVIWEIEHKLTIPWVGNQFAIVWEIEHKLTIIRQLPIIRQFPISWEKGMHISFHLLEGDQEGQEDQEELCTNIFAFE